MDHSPQRRWRAYDLGMRWWAKDGTEDNERRRFLATADGQIVVIWRHDESTFYANERRKIRWVHESEPATPYFVFLLPVSNTTRSPNQ